MSQFNDGNSKGYIATAALSKGTIVKIASGEVVAAALATDKAIGVVQDDVDAGNTASVKLRNGSGTYKVIAGGTIAVGDYVASDASGHAVATTTANDEVVGLAVEAGVDNDLVEVIPALHQFSAA